jgi:chromosome partitioning protein
MIVTVVNIKGGVGKTTTAVTLAAYMNKHAPTMLLGPDKFCDALIWAGKGKGLGFKAAPIAHWGMLAPSYTHTVIDSEQGPSEEDLVAAAEGSTLLVITAVPREGDTPALVKTIKALQTAGATNYRVLLTRVRPHYAPAAKVLREQLAEIGAPVFVAEIPELEVFDKAVGAGLIVCCVRDKMAARAWAAYAAVGEELMA